MTTPSGAGGFDTTGRFAITGTDGSVPQLVNNTQAYITGVLKAQIKQTPSWQPLSDQFIKALVAWLGGVLGLPAGTQTDLENFLNGKFDLVLAIQQALSGIDLSNPGTVLTAIENAAGSAFKGIIPASWIANVVQELVPGGNFPTADSVKPGGPFSWDGATAGALSGFSAKVTANGTLLVLESDMFQVTQGQQLAASVYPAWTALTFNSGTTPIRLGVMPYSDPNSPLTRVDIANLLPSTGTQAWTSPLSASWAVPSGVTWATLALVVTADATAGDVRFSNASAHMTNLIDQALVNGLQTALNNLGTLINNAAGTIQTVMDTVAAKVGSTMSDIQNRLAPITAAGQLDAGKLAAVTGSIAFALVPGLQQIVDAIQAGNGGAAGQAITSLNSLISAMVSNTSIANGSAATANTNISNLLGGMSVANIAALVTKLQTTQTQAANALTSASTIAAGQISGTLTQVQNTWDAIANALGISGTGNSLTTVQNQTIQLNQTAIAAMAGAAMANAQLAAQNAQSNAGATGLNFSVAFSGANQAALPAQFSGSDIVIGANGYASIKTSDPNGTYQTICNQLYTTDNQAASVVLGNYGGSTNAPLIVLFHSNTTCTQGAYMQITNAGVTLGSYSGALGSRTYTPFSGGSWSGQLGSSSLVEVYNTGTAYSLLVGGNVVLNCTGSGVTLGSSYRSGALVMTRASTTGWFGGTTVYDAFSVVSFAMSDYIIPTYVGSSASMTRTTATSTSIASGSANVRVNSLVPASFFTVVEMNTSDITPTLASGKFQVSLTGSYLVTIGYKIAIGSTTTDHQAGILLYKNGSIYREGGQVANSRDTTDSINNSPAGMSMSWPVYLVAGDYVQAGAWFVSSQSSDALGLLADTAGTTTYFMISLLNRTQL